MEVTGAVSTTALSAWHRERGAQIGVWFGCDLPTRFRDLRAEYGALRETVGLLDKNYRAYLEFTGPDRARYLNAILTNDIKGLAQNHGTVSLFLNPQGHIQAEIETYALPETLLCVSYATIRERLIPAMDKYIIMDDVTLTDRSEAYATLALEGPRAAALVQKVSGVDLTSLAELESTEATIEGLALRLVKRSPGGVAGAEFLVMRERCAELWMVLEAAVHGEGGASVGYEALNVRRLELGVPWFTYDFGERQIPHEAGLQDSHISYTKGCYTGQEIVERVRSRGQVNRVRVSLKFAGDATPEANTPLFADGKESGMVTRVGFSPAANAWIGMGYVRREQSAVGCSLSTPHSYASVVNTPIA